MHIDRDMSRFLLIVSALGVLSFVGTWWPSSMEKAALQQRISAARERIRTDQSSISNVSMLETEVIDLQYVLDAKTQQIPSSIDLAGLIRDLTRLMNDHHLKNQVISPLPEVACDHYHRLPVRIVFQAPSATLFQFLREVETMPRLVRIERLMIDRKSSDEQSLDITSVTVTMDITAIYTPPISSGAEVGS